MSAVRSPLDGLHLQVGADGDGPAERWAVGAARRVLRRLGATVAELTGGRGSPGARLGPAPPGWGSVGGLPSGATAQAAGMVLAAAALAAAGGERAVTVDPDVVAAHLLLPLLLADDDPMGPVAAPTAPWPTADGAVCADLGAEGDADAFARLVALGPGGSAPGWTSEDLAARAQEWRLPVTPYRRRAPVDAAPDPVRLGPSDGRGATDGAPEGGGAAVPAPRSWPPLAGRTVLDLTVMWSGPLCTSLLRQLGARVVKIEPDCRLDGTRFSPGGRLFHALNDGKERAPLDLRRPPDRAAFDELVAEADLVVDNFSPRVTANLGIDHRALTARRPGLATLGLPAFPPGPERHWVSYGTGVHAAVGLGDTGGADAGSRRFAAPAVTYPDPLAGLTAAVAGLALLVGAERGWAPPHAEVALADAVRPLLAVADDGALTRPLDPDLVRGLAGRFGAPLPCPIAPAAERTQEDGVRRGR